MSDRGRSGAFKLRAVAGTIRVQDGRRLPITWGGSREGKFLRKCEAELVAQVRGLPSFAQRLLIRRVARAMLRLEAFDARMASGAWTDGDARTYGGLSNSLRLMLRELGFRSATERPRRLADVLNGAG